MGLPDNINVFTICFILFIAVIDIHGQRSVSFEYESNNLCSPAVVTFHNQSEYKDVISFVWDFGNGEKIESSEKNFVHIFSEPGEFQVKLSAIYPDDTSFIQQMISVFKIPDANYATSPNLGCLPLEVRFEDVSLKGDGNIEKWFWDFRNGEMSELQNPVVEFDSPGEYAVYLRVTDSNGCQDDIELEGAVRVFNKPLVDFNALDRASCTPPLEVNFINNTFSEYELSYSWNFGNGMMSDEKNPVIVYENGGWYDVSLSVDGGQGCMAKKNVRDFVKIAFPESHFLVIQNEDTLNIEETDTICSGLIEFRSASAGDYQCKWIIEDVSYPGKYIKYYADNSNELDVKLITGIETACPDTLSKTFFIDIIRTDFQIIPDKACKLPISLQLYNQSVNINQWEWIFPDSSVSNEQNAEYVIDYESFHNEYDNNTTTVSYPFSLRGTNERGCHDMAEKNLNIQLPVARFVVNKSSGCIPLTVVCSDSSHSSEEIKRRSWYINGDLVKSSSSATFEYIFDLEGEHHVQLVIENDAGCIDTSGRMTISAGKKLRPGFQVDKKSICYNEKITFSDLSELKDSIDYWNYYSPGIYSSGFDTLSTNALAIKHSSPGYFDAYLQLDYNGCISDTIYRNFLYGRGPTGHFNSEMECENPYDYRFIQKLDQASHFEWKSEDKFLTNKDTLNYQFINPGDYLIRLHAANDTSGCSYITEDIIKVRDVKADFLVKPFSCLGQEVKLDAMKSEDYINNCFEEGLLWIFGDETAPRRSHTDSMVHSYWEKGEFEITLIAMDANECTDTTRRTIQIVGPEASFKIDTNKGCYPSFKTTFHNTTNDPDVIEWEWIFGDGKRNNENIMDVGHEYSSHNSSVFKAGLEVKDKYGCKNTAYKKIHLIKPDADFTVDDHSICINDPVRFRYNNEMDSVRWNYGDGSDMASNNIHTYSLPGYYDVSLTVFKEKCTTTERKTKYIFVEDPSAFYHINDSISSCYPHTITFSHLNEGSVIKNGTWIFDENTGNSSGYRKEVAYTYTKPGSYNTSLHITTVNNCKASYEKEITISGPYAVPEISDDRVCAEESILFTITEPEDINEFRWLFGDGVTADEALINHQYEQEGWYDPYLEIADSDGCEVLIPVSRIFVSKPIAEFGIVNDKEAYCEGEDIQVEIKNARDLSWKWLFDERSYPGRNLKFVQSFQNPGMHQISLIVQDSLRCRDTTIVNVIIDPLPEISVNDDTTVCIGDQIQLEALTGVNNVKWWPEQGLNDRNIKAPIARIVKPIYYMAEARSPGGCVNTDSVYIDLIPPNFIGRKPLNDTVIEIGQRINLKIETTNESEYFWFPGHKISCRDCPSPEVRPFESITYFIDIKDQCSVVREEFLIKVIRDYTLGLPKAFTPNGDGYNDIIYAKGKKIKKLIEFKIYNRFGNLVFQTNRLDDGWDGYYRGKKQKTDTYTYYIKAITIHDFEVTKSGTFVLLE